MSTKGGIEMATKKKKSRVTLEMDVRRSICFPAKMWDVLIGEAQARQQTVSVVVRHLVLERLMEIGKWTLPKSL
jgi:hypothetical protein